MCHPSLMFHSLIFPSLSLLLLSRVPSPVCLFFPDVSSALTTHCSYQNEQGRDSGEGGGDRRLPPPPIGTKKRPPCSILVEIPLPYPMNHPLEFRRPPKTEKPLTVALLPQSTLQSKCRNMEHFIECKISRKYSSLEQSTIVHKSARLSNNKSLFKTSR